MARKSRRAGAEKALPETPKVQTVPTAIYARLSVENSGKAETVDVIANQIEICKSYVAGSPDLELVDVYSDGCDIIGLRQQSLDTQWFASI